METWVSSHGSAGTVLGQQSYFIHTLNETGSTIRPTQQAQLKCSVIFPLPTPPPHASHFTVIAVDFTAHDTLIDGVKLMSGNEVVYSKIWLQKNQSFRLKLPDGLRPSPDPMGLGLVVDILFDTVNSKLDIQSAGLKIAVIAPEQVKTLGFDSGTWSTEQVRLWTAPQAHTNGQIKFNTKFSTAPVVSVSAMAVDLSGSGLRFKVYATNVDNVGFTVHADTWGDTSLYSCVVSWVAIGS
ncbi:hypothetical protein QQS21_007951 [Conoideocrella luteorostrata]|uniref:H-type lectin domain-containing protein n=1 Tax=Conoideocrella luteorostrata TaxID=1105319 RepID=A0AAJ0CJS6_9HYPO|nr:hypothetical protein QQS21_007951 [Conoideocrella luteorostrata]